MSVSSFWDDHYGQRDQVWSGRPNAALVDEVTTLSTEPGRALDLGCGEGADAVWLAGQGWDVVGVDVSQVALDRAARAAATAGVAVTLERHDVASSLPDGPFDLVSACFFHSPVELPREEVLRRAAALVSPGGTLLVVGHAAPPPWAPAGHHSHDGMPQPRETVDALDLDDDAWQVDVAEVRGRAVTAPDGTPATLLDSVVRLGRRPRSGR